MAPNSAYELNKMHGCKDGEGLTLALALLPDKTTDTYRELVGCLLRTAVVDAFADIGLLKYIIVDFERAAVNTFTEVFP